MFYSGGAYGQEQGQSRARHTSSVSLPYPLPAPARSMGRRRAHRNPPPPQGRDQAPAYSNPQHGHPGRDSQRTGLPPRRREPAADQGRCRQPTAGTRHPPQPQPETSSSSGTDTDTEADSGTRRDDPTHRRLVDHALARQYQHMGHSTGRVCDITPPIVRPHDALPPDMKRRVRDRTGKKNRKDLTFHEYVCGYTRMLLTEIDPHTDLYAMINHLSQVAQDAAVAPWPAVRTWTTTCLDYIHDDQASWQDSALFTDERNRIRWSQGRTENTTPIPCHAYNTDTCKQVAPHHEGEYRLLHTCAICYYAAPSHNRAEATTHNAKTCNRRKRSGGRDEWDAPPSKYNGKRQGSAGNHSSLPKKETTDAKQKN